MKLAKFRNLTKARQEDGGFQSRALRKGMAIVQHMDSSQQVLQKRGRSLSPIQPGPQYDQVTLTLELYVRESNRSSVRHPVRKSEFTLNAHKESAFPQPELVNYTAHQMKTGST